MSTTDNAKTKAATPVPVEESTERLNRPLIQLAKACGVATFYIDQLGDYTEITDEALVGVLDALGWQANTEENIANSLKRVQEKRDSELLPPTVVCFNGTKTIVPVHTGGSAIDPSKIHVTLTLEQNTRIRLISRLITLRQAKRATYCWNFQKICQWVTTL